MDDRLQERFFSSMMCFKKLEALFSLECEMQMNEMAILRDILGGCSVSGSSCTNLNVPRMQERLRISKPAVSYILNTLEKKNYIVREIDAKDRRKISISATPEGGGRFTSRLFYRVFNRYANIQYQLETERFRILSRRAINRVHAMSRTIPYRKALYANCGLKLERLRYRPAGDGGKAGADRERPRLAADALILFTNVAYRLALCLAFVMMALTLIVTGYTVVVYLSGSPVEGWTTTMLFLGFGFFGMFAILTLVLKYLSVLVELSFRRQRYVFESIEKLSR